MSKPILTLVLLLVSLPGWCREILELPHQAAADVVWDRAERQYYSTIWEKDVVTNVSRPSLEVFRPAPEISTSTAVIIAPGGGLFALSINSEGNDVAEWLNNKGISAFVLKYRLVPTGEDGVQEFRDARDQLVEKVSPVLPLAIADGLAAVTWVRSHAGELDIDPRKVGFMGFSAGGTVAMGVTYTSTTDTRPDFIVPVYPWLSPLEPREIVPGAPPMLVICASDDSLGLAQQSVNLYSAWLAAGISAELHMYARGGHGFGMQRSGLPSDGWIERFYDWSIGEGIMTPGTAP